MPDQPAPAQPPASPVGIPFDRVLCINLDRRPDRWEGFLAFATPHIPADRIERFPAFDAQCLLTPSWWTGTPGGYACTLSHRFAIAKVFAEGAETALIFEDDAMLAPDFGDRLTAFRAEVPSDWQLLYLGGQHRPRSRPAPVSPGVVRCLGTFRMHAYVLHRSGAALVHDEMAKTRKICDQKLADLNPRLPAYAPKHWMVAQRADFSDVESRRHGKDRWWD
ncbi:MAG: glycosyltransferase family 25 protein [Phycisphaerales bacterium]|nr:glycosyltransferase family 25 protein [Phycisphaerales bacterium]